MTKTTGNFTDFVSFSRASGGTALRRISYGSELVTNGTFDTDTSGWTFEGTATNTSAAGYLEGITGAATNVLVSAPITTVIGKTYVVTGDLVSTNNFGAIFAGSSIYAQNLGSTGYMTSGSFGTFTFKATTTTTYISVLAGDANKTVRVDNISVKEVLFDRADGTLQLFNHPTNVPRVEYDASGNWKGLLIEEARTNLVTYSSEFDNAYWVKASGATVSANAVISPDGTQNADTLICPNSSDTIPDVYVASLAVTSGVTYTFSVWLKGASNGAWPLNVYNGASHNPLVVNVTTEWQRFVVTVVASGTTMNVYLCDKRSSVSGSNTYLDSVDAYGAQLEAGAFPTSYIPTTGATATRAADICSIATSAFGYNQKAGTIVVEAERFGTNNYPRTVMIDNGNEAESIGLGSWGATNAITGYIVDSGVVQAVMGTGNAGTSPFKNALAYKANDFAASRDGGTPVTDTSGTVPLDVNTMRFGRNENTSQYLNGHIKSVRYYPRRLSNAQLVALTS